MTEVLTWGKWEHYKKKFKAKGFELKVEVERKGYRNCDKGPRTFDDINDFKIFINGKYNMQFHLISFDILDCILFSYLNGMKLMEEKK